MFVLLLLLNEMVRIIEAESPDSSTISLRLSTSTDCTGQNNNQVQRSNNSRPTFRRASSLILCDSVSSSSEICDAWATGLWAERSLRELKFEESAPRNAVINDNQIDDLSMAQFFRKGQLLMLL